MNYKVSVLGLLALFASSAIARPCAGVLDDADPVPQKSRVTAFVVTDKGVKVECWEIGDLLPDGNAARGVHLRAGNDGLQGVDLLTWPEPTLLWPPPTNGVHNYALDLAEKPNLYTIKSGLVTISVKKPKGNASIQDDDYPDYTYQLENGDDWFYFEDTYTSPDSLRSVEDSSITVRTASSSDTTVINFKYKGTPSHTVLHEGRCSFAGLTSDNPSSRRVDMDRPRTHLRAQDL